MKMLWLVRDDLQAPVWAGKEGRIDLEEKKKKGPNDSELTQYAQGKLDVKGQYSPLLRRVEID